MAHTGVSSKGCNTSAYGLHSPGTAQRLAAAPEHGYRVLHVDDYHLRVRIAVAKQAPSVRIHKQMAPNRPINAKEQPVSQQHATNIKGLMAFAHTALGILAPHPSVESSASCGYLHATVTSLGKKKRIPSLTRDMEPRARHPALVPLNRS